MTDIYLVPYHSVPGRNLHGSSGHFRVVEEEITAGVWPYDNGDDPSFYVARHGGPLTWGVCRQDLRNPIKVGTIVVFFAYGPDGPKSKTTKYRLAGVATVVRKLDRREVFQAEEFKPFLPLYLSLLIQPTASGWVHEEPGRRPQDLHKSWLWGIAEQNLSKDDFEKEYSVQLKEGRFADGEVPIAKNYVVFSSDPTETYISSAPPLVAKASPGCHEEWVDPELHRLTVLKASQATRGHGASCGCGRHQAGRDYLRSINPTNRNLHRQPRFKLPSAKAASLRESLIQALRGRDC